MKLPYHLLDVFTDRPFAGNPLAVFTNGQGISSETMQLIAKELNLSETTFVLPPSDTANNYRVRIFTPGAELPIAGHPTIGTTFILAKEGMVELQDGETVIQLEEGVGPLPVTIHSSGGQADFIEMGQPLPRFGPRFDDIAGVAEMLSLEPEALAAPGLPIEVVSCGMPFLFVPIKDLAAIRRIRFRTDVWERVLRPLETQEVFVFTKEVELEGSTVHSRMFAPSLGIVEDPATGGASGSLGCYLVRHQVIPSDGELKCVSEQGIEMGRPSIIKIRIAHRDGEITGVRVGGHCRYMGAGHFEL